MSKGITVQDLEKVMGRKASKVSDYEFDPETMSFGRTITFDLKPTRKAKNRNAKRQK